MKDDGDNRTAVGKGELFLHGAHLAFGPEAETAGNLYVRDGRIEAIEAGRRHRPPSRCTSLDLSGFLLLPGLINAHDHLEFSLYPRLGNPPYRNYIEWGEDIHAQCAGMIGQQHAVPREVRLWWGGIRNLLSGVTTVCHHNPLYPELTRADFPVRVVKRYGWAHSPALGGDLRAARQRTPKGSPFIVHACEGLDALAHSELQQLESLGLLDENLVVVHGLALMGAGVAMLRQCRASLVLCPSSNQFLFGQIPDLRLLRRIDRVALGSDSPLTAAGDMLDEIRFGIRHCGIEPREALRMVTSSAAAILRLGDAVGRIKPGATADLIALKDAGCGAEEQLRSLSADQIELVVVGGTVHLASNALRERLPVSMTRELEPVMIGTSERWLRAPVGDLLRKAEAVLGDGRVRLGGRTICSTETVGAPHA